MPLKDRREEYSWPKTNVVSLVTQTEKRAYSIEDTVSFKTGFRVVGGLKDAFQPDVWTLAWEDFDKVVRLTFEVKLAVRRGPAESTIAKSRKEVRRASLYWSRDPDLPYRIWPMIIPEGGGPPIIPRSVEDAKSKMFEVEKTFEVPALALGRGHKRIVARAKVSWGRRSFIEKGSVERKSKPLAVEIE